MENERENLREENTLLEKWWKSSDDEENEKRNISSKTNLRQTVYRYSYMNLTFTLSDT